MSRELKSTTTKLRTKHSLAHYPTLLQLCSYWIANYQTNRAYLAKITTKPNNTTLTTYLVSSTSYTTTKDYKISCITTNRATAAVHTYLMARI